MNRLQMCVAMAELDGVEVKRMASQRAGTKDWLLAKPKYGPIAKYNPIDDLGLNCKYRDKYNVNIKHRGMLVEISVINTSLKAVGFARVLDKELIPIKVIECILKANKMGVAEK